MNTLYFISEIFFGFVFFSIMWIIYPYSFSLFALYRTAPLLRWFQQVIFSIIAGFFGYFSSMFIIENDKFKTIFPEKTSQNEEAIHEQIKYRSNELNNNTVTEQKEANLKKNEVNYNEVKVQYDGDDPIVRKRLGLPPKDVLINKETEVLKLTNEEIEEAERKAQYHGDDPIIRNRLGLPPKNQN